MRILDKMANIEKNDSLTKQYDAQLQSLLSTYSKQKLTYRRAKTNKKIHRLHRKGIFYLKKSINSESLKYFEKSLKIRKEIDDREGICAS